MTIMQAARWLAPHRIETGLLPVPALGEGEARVRVRSVGICGSDLAIVTGKHPRARAPLVIGHELAGDVVELASDHGTDLAIGHRVTLYPLLSCSECAACRRDFGHVCKNLRVIGFDRDGGMAELLTVPATNLVRLPDAMSFSTGALIEPLSVAIHALAMARAGEEEFALVMGSGPIGLLLALALRARGQRQVLVTDVHPQRLALARGLGFAALDARDPTLFGQVAEATDGEGPGLVFEAAGAAPVARQMTELARPRAEIVVVSVFKEPAPVDLRALNFKELRIIGSRVYTREDYAKAIALADRLPLAALVTKTLPLSEAPAAFDALFRGEDVCKLLLDPQPPEGCP